MPIYRTVKRRLKPSSSRKSKTKSHSSPTSSQKKENGTDKSGSLPTRPNPQVRAARESVEAHATGARHRGRCRRSCARSLPRQFPQGRGKEVELGGEPLSTHGEKAWQLARSNRHHTSTCHNYAEDEEDSRGSNA